MKNVSKPQNLEVDTLLEKMTIRRIKSGEFKQLFELVGEAFKREEEITGLSVQRLRRLGKLYRLIEILLPVFDLFHIDLETILVAVADNKLIGEIHVSPVGKGIWSLDSAAVDGMFRGHGVYKRLLYESLEYIQRKGGRKAVTSLWTDNIAPVKMTNRLGFRVYAEEILLQSEIGQLPSNVPAGVDVSIRKMKQTDVKKVYRMSRVLNRERIDALETTEKDFSDSFVRRLRRRILWTRSERWVMEKGKEVVGYAHIAYSSAQQAAEIMAFGVVSTSGSSDLAVSMLREVLSFLRKENIRKVTTFLNKKWSEAIEIFELFEFKPIASVYEMVKKIT